MKFNLQYYAVRREFLVALSERQRRDVVRAALPWRNAASAFDRSVDVLRALPYPPRATLGVAAALMVWRPRSVLRLARRVLFGLQWWQTVRSRFFTN